MYLQINLEISLQNVSFTAAWHQAVQIVIYTIFVIEINTASFLYTLVRVNGTQF